MLINNRKGEIPLVILVMGILTICVLAILSFEFSNFSKDELGIGLFEELSSDIETFSFSSKIFGVEKAVENFGGVIEGNKIVFKKTKAGILSVEYKFVP